MPMSQHPWASGFSILTKWDSSVQKLDKNKVWEQVQQVMHLGPSLYSYRPPYGYPCLLAPYWGGRVQKLDRFVFLLKAGLLAGIRGG